MGQMAESLSEKRQMGSNGSIPGPVAHFEQEVVTRLLLGLSPILHTWLIYEISMERKNNMKGGKAEGT